MAKQKMDDEVVERQDIVEENSLICVLTGEFKKDNEKEQNLQSLIRMLNEEYGFELKNMERDFPIVGENEEGKKWKRKIELVIVADGKKHIQENIIRLCIVLDSKTKETDKKKGVITALENALGAVENCEFGLWTNGNNFSFLQKKKTRFDLTFEELSDFPGVDESLEDLERSDKYMPRNPANDSLVRTFKSCHDYIYGNEGMKKTAFWQLLNLIFCKIYDEQRRIICAHKNETYRRKFWVGVKENNTEKGRSEIAKRIKDLFKEVKQSPLFKDVFQGNEEIELTDKGLGFIAGILAKYSFLDATVDVKGLAYETIVSNTLKQEAGQFFTPRNVVKLMVEILDPDENHRVLDVACGSGGFLVMVLEQVRKKIAGKLYPKLSGEWLREKYNSPDVNDKVREYAQKYLFGIDFDPDLKRAARMNMVMSGDGHANVFQFNSLEYPRGANIIDMRTFEKKVNESISKSPDAGKFYHAHALEKFDMIFTNPPFGAKIPINDPEVLSQFDLGYCWRKTDQGNWVKTDLSSSEPPEILFIDRCYQFLKPGGKMAIVLPDGILGNPNTEYLRAWVLERFSLLASIDLPVETFLPQVGVQASLLFLQKLTDKQRSIARDKSYNYDIFMAIAEKVGKDRRGVAVYERDEDGAEIITEKIVEYLHYDRKRGKKVLKVRKEKTPNIDDDLPKITEAYKQFLKAKI